MIEILKMLIYVISELYYRTSGLRKPGMLMGRGGRDVEYKNVTITITNPKEFKDYIDLSGAPEIDQGRVGSCAHATLVGLVIDQVIAKTGNKNFWIDWKVSWEEMKKMGIASDDKGSYLEDNLWFFQQHGFQGNDGKLYMPKAIEPIRKSEIELYLNNGYQIYTGAACGRPFCTPEWIWIPNQRTYGHSFRKKGINKKPTVKADDFIVPKGWIDETTWHNYGHKKESEFFMNFGDEQRLFACFVIELDL